ncbi:MAG: pre-peptidase C-terminal domain-containing protein [Deltaproteobacteria bacterium]|nr:pre-peptidase C-terminal domain-containing protein [Deltaproteobacteria bacterium]
MRISHLFGLLVVGSAVAGISGGCSSDSDTETSTGGGGTTSTSSTTGSGTTTTTPTSSGGGEGGGTPVDESTSCDDAVEMEELENTLGGTFYEGTAVINPAGDEDFFTFTADAGQWIQLSTDANPDDDPAMIDAVVTLYNEDGSTQLAEADDQTPRVTTDSELFFRVETAGTYCVRVMEFSEWYGNTPEGDPSYSYRLIALPVDFELYEHYNEDSDATTASSNDNINDAQSGLTVSTGDTGMIFTQLAGMLEPGADVDVFEFVPPSGTLALATNFGPSGTDGYGSTKGPGLLQIRESNGTTVLAQLDYQDGSDGFSSVPVTAGNTYYVWVERPDTNVGSNDFYFMKYSTADVTNPQESMPDTDNDVYTGADADPNPSTDPQTGTISHFIGGNVPVGDTDWWSFGSVPAGNQIAIACSSQRAGSGVGDFTIEYYEDPQGSSVEDETETATADIYWGTGANPSKGPVTAGTTGTHYLKISATTEIAGVTSRHYLCGVHVMSP